MLLRAKLSQNWVKYLKIVVNAHNETPIKKLGWMKPNQIHTEFDSTLVDIEKKKHNIETYREPDFDTQKLLQETHIKNNKKLQVNDYVYLDLKENLFDKSYDIQV
jgi:hypothetical protein